MPHMGLRRKGGISTFEILKTGCLGFPYGKPRRDAGLGHLKLSNHGDCQLAVVAVPIIHRP